VIALAELGVSTKRMDTQNAAALVGAAMLSVLLFPMTAMFLRKRPSVEKVPVADSQ
jgi:hypothetical protein